MEEDYLSNRQVRKHEPVYSLTYTPTLVKNTMVGLDSQYPTVQHECFSSMNHCFSTDTLPHVNTSPVSTLLSTCKKEWLNRNFFSV
ncbi:hypothetical protein AQUCO_04200171v1 [Aquilegia coerulea]|uniref:Uncharacterized protein n=1 Tax=Aquilegia coerulea TaxID=218851 RepID=A0A2G5CPW6_AQUCA|nr:hypothetical protein AQUCO_04200171v1 [Aquilegia coerulea]